MIDTITLKTFTMPAGNYVIADICITSDDYYYKVLDEWINFNSGWSAIIADGIFLYCTGSDGACDVERLNEEPVGTFPIDAANISIVPAAYAHKKRHGVPVEFDKEFMVKVYDDAIIIGDEYRIRI